MLGWVGDGVGGVVLKRKGLKTESVFTVWCKHFRIVHLCGDAWLTVVLWVNQSLISKKYDTSVTTSLVLWSPFQRVPDHYDAERRNVYLFFSFSNKAFQLAGVMTRTHHFCVHCLKLPNHWEGLSTLHFSDLLLKKEDIAKALDTNTHAQKQKCRKTNWSWSVSSSCTQ